MLKALVIGAGSIGALKPEGMDEPGTDNILTHAHAYHADPETTLAGIVDEDDGMLLRALRKWDPFGGHGYMNIRDAMAAIQPHIVSVCTPTETHLEVVRNIIASGFLPPKVLIVEKPCGTNYEECLEIVELCDACGIGLMINYQRRFCPTFVDMADRFRLGSEIPLAATLAYGRGLRRDGCHGLDLFRFLFGKCVAAHKIEPPIFELEGDPTYGMQLKFRGCSFVNMVPIHSRVGYGLFNLEIWTDEGLHRFSNYTISHSFCRKQGEGTFGSGYMSLGTAIEPQPNTGLTKVLSVMARTAVQIATTGYDKKEHRHIATGEDALAVHRIIEGDI